MSTDGCGQIGGGSAPPGAGVLYLSIGEGYAELTSLSISFLRSHGYRGPVRVVTDHASWEWPDLGDVELVRVDTPPGAWGSRFYKTQLHNFAFPITLFLDSDTLAIGSLDPLWDELRWGDICMAHDSHHSTAGEFADANWDRRSIDREELRLMKEPGFSELGWYNSGVILWRRNEATDRLFETWGREWSRFGRIDQGALARALKSSAPALHALSSIWNSTPNRFASIKAARRAGVRILHFLSKQRPLLSRFIAADEQDAEPAPRGTALQVQEPTARRPLRALWITSTLFPRIGGIETYVEKAVGSLCAHCDVGLVTRRGQWLRDGSPITHFVLSGPVGGANAEAWRSMADGLQRLIDRFEPDVVHFANARSASCRAIVPSEVATVATVHGNDLTNLRPEDREEDPTPYIVESLNACDKVLTCSDYASNLAREWGVRTPIDTITPGCDLEFYRPRPALGRAARGRLKIPQDAPMILTVSRLVPRKGHLTVLEAIRRLPFPAYWVVAGAGPCKGEIIAAVRENGLADQVRMLGAVSDETLLGLYNACDLFVLTPESQRLGPWLDSEGFGLVLQEASACGKPVISSTSGGCQDAVIDGGTGLLTPPGDPERLSEAMGAILTDADFARSLGEGGLQLVRMSGGWPRLARQTFEAYEDLLDRRRVAHAL